VELFISEMNLQKFQILSQFLKNRSWINYKNAAHYSVAPVGKFENRNILKLKERGLIVGIFPEQE